MNWSLRSQLTFPLIGLAVLTLLAVTWLNVNQAEKQSRKAIQGRLYGVIDTLESAAFPLTEPVLWQMTGLSGARFVLTDDRGKVLASSFSVNEPIDFGKIKGHLSQSLFDRSVVIAGENYFGRMARARVPEQRLFVLYPDSLYRDLRRAAITPPIVIGVVSAVLAAWLGALIAKRVSRPVSQLQRQVNRIAGGNFDTVLPRGGARELVVLSDAINSMAARLAKHERDVRSNERLRTLGQLGGGIAHHIRNCITGTRLALDLHRRSCPNLGDEALEVAARQLSLTEEYVQRFLTIGSERESQKTDVDIRELFDTTLLLLEATAKHAQVSLTWTPPPDGVHLQADQLALQQLLVNLVMNSIEAVNATIGSGCGHANAAPPQVKVSCEMVGDRLAVKVSDNGPGPAPAISQRMFEPLVSDKHDGVGLGLSVAADVARKHGGNLEWEHADGWTSFTFAISTQKGQACHN